MLIVGDEGNDQTKREDVEKFANYLDLILKLASVLVDLLDEGCVAYMSQKFEIACEQSSLPEELMKLINEFEKDLQVFPSFLPLPSFSNLISELRAGEELSLKWGESIIFWTTLR